MAIGLVLLSGCNSSSQSESSTVNIKESSVITEVPSSESVGKWDVYSREGIDPFITMGIEYPSYKIVFKIQKNSYHSKAFAEMRVMQKTENGFKSIPEVSYNIKIGNMTAFSSSEVINIPENDIEKFIEVLEKGDFTITLTNEKTAVVYDFSITNQTKGVSEAWDQIQ